MSRKRTCSGSASRAAAARVFEYRFDLVSSAEPEDVLIERAGAKVLVDSLSHTYLAGSEIDYVNDLMSASFKIKNPNATAACGCGTSFSVSSRSIVGALASTAIG
jgi:iron-sulfur cluster assembly accessory protein